MRRDEACAHGRNGGRSPAPRQMRGERLIALLPLLTFLDLDSAGFQHRPVRNDHSQRAFFGLNQERGRLLTTVERADNWNVGEDGNGLTASGIETKAPIGDGSAERIE